MEQKGHTASFAFGNWITTKSSMPPTIKPYDPSSACPKEFLLEENSMYSGNDSNSTATHLRYLRGSVQHTLCEFASWNHEP